MVRRLEPWERTCPECGTVYMSVQEMGICPKCSLHFSVDRDGTILIPGYHPKPRPKLEPFQLPDDIDSYVEKLPESIRSRVSKEFPEEDQVSVLRLLAVPEISGGEYIWNAILDRANGHAQFVEPLVLTVKSDWRDLFIPKSSDNRYLIDKLIKNLRFTKVLNDDEIEKMKHGFSEERTFSDICESIWKCDKTISDEQHNRIITIALRLNYPQHSLDWLTEHVVDSNGQRKAKKRPWWKLW